MSGTYQRACDANAILKGHSHQGPTLHDRTRNLHLSYTEWCHALGIKAMK